MVNGSRNRYFVKNKADGTFEDMTTKFDGVAVLKVTGFSGKGKPVNIYTEQWVNEQEEDFLIANSIDGTPVVIRENVDIELTFIVRKKYALTQANLDVLHVHDQFVDYMTNTDIWVKSSYFGNKYVHCICLKEYKPTTIMLNRGDNSYMMGTITLHSLNSPTT